MIMSPPWDQGVEVARHDCEELTILIKLERKIDLMATVGPKKSSGDAIKANLTTELNANASLGFNPINKNEAAINLSSSEAYA